MARDRIDRHIALHAQLLAKPVQVAIERARPDNFGRSNVTQLPPLPRVLDPLEQRHPDQHRDDERDALGRPESD